MSKINSIEELIHKYIEENIEFDEIFKDINFELIYNDPVLKGEVTVPYILMLKEFQDSVYLAYLSFIEKNENLTHLTDYEKKALRLKYKVEDGSDKFYISFEDSNVLLEQKKDALSKLSKTELFILTLVSAGYLSLEKLTEIIEQYEQKTSDDTKSEKELDFYNSFRKIKLNLINKTFNRKKIESLHLPLYEYENNFLITKEVRISSKEAHEMKINSIIEKEIKEGLFIVNGLRGASENNNITTFWFIDVENREFSIQLKRNDLDILRKQFLYRNIGKFVDLKLEIIRKDKVIIKKDIIYLNAAEGVDEVK